MLFIDFSSAFNTIIPQQLTHKLVQLGLNTSLCNWLLDFLNGRPQAVRVGINTSSTITLNTGAPQGCVLSPLLFTLLTHDCTPSHNSNLFIKFADDTTVVGLISNRDETNYRREVSRLAGWCRDNNLSLNVEKTKEIVVDFRRVHTQHAPLTINGATVERASSTKFLGVHITEDLSWTNNTAATGQESTASVSTSFLRKLRESQSPDPHHVHLLQSHHREQSWLAASLCGMAPATRPAASPSTDSESSWEDGWCPLSPSLQDIYSTRLHRKALSIAGDPTHPSHSFSVCCHQGGDCGVSRRGPADWRTASYIRLSGSWTPSRPCPPPSFTPRNTELWHYDPPPAPTSPGPSTPLPYKLWPTPVTLCSTGLISTSSSIDCKLPLLTVW